MNLGQRYQQTLDFLFTQLPMYQRQGAAAYKKDLTNTIALCNALGNPEKEIKCVHLAGTNGKGTTAHTIASILQEAGYKTGLHTSPHLKDFRERIKINGQMAEQSFVVQFVEQNKDIIDELKPSFFEITVVMAFEYFRQQAVDIAIIETGMGGRLDSTNVVSPLVTAITAIGLDHTAFLGNTLEAIAREKGGIIKQSTPVVLYDFKNENIKQVLCTQAKALGAPINDHAEQYNISPMAMGVVSINAAHFKLNELKVAIPGAYYLRNLPVALEVIHELKHLNFTIADSCIKKGIEKVVSNTGLKGRWQVLNHSPFTFADVGHNMDGIAAIIRQIESMSFEKLHVVWGSVSDKDLEEIFNLMPTDAFYYFCEANIPRALPISELEAIGEKRNLEYRLIKEVNEALNAARKVAGPHDIIWIGGSTFVVAELEEL